MLILHKFLTEKNRETLAFANFKEEKQMKKLMLGMLLASTVSANTIEEATSLFASRANNEAGLQNAIKAADMFKSLAASAATTEEKAMLKMKESEAIYFVGNRVSGKNNILAQFQRGYEAADFAAKNLKGSEKAEALYWYTANQGRWGETNGVLSSLSRWKGEMKPALDKVIAMGEEAQSVQHYGALRIYGKAQLKVPFASKKKGLAKLEKAYNSTLKTMEVDGEEIEISGQVNNVVFFLWGLAKEDKKTDTFCEIFEAAEILFDGGTEAFEAYDATQVPETEKELTDFFEGKGEYETAIDYADENC
jgi:hypothetical protein